MHTDEHAASSRSTYFDRQGFIDIINGDVDFTFLIGNLFTAGCQLNVTQFLQCIIRIRNQFSDEDFLIRIKWSSNNVQQLLRFRLKLMFLHTYANREVYLEPQVLAALTWHRLNIRLLRTSSQISLNWSRCSVRRCLQNPMMIRWLILRTAVINVRCRCSEACLTWNTGCVTLKNTQRCGKNRSMSNNRSKMHSVEISCSSTKQRRQGRFP